MLLYYLSKNQSPIKIGQNGIKFNYLNSIIINFNIQKKIKTNY